MPRVLLTKSGRCTEATAASAGKSGGRQVRNEKRGFWCCSDAQRETVEEVGGGRRGEEEGGEIRSPVSALCTRSSSFPAAP